MGGVASDEALDHRDPRDARDQASVASLLRKFRLEAGLSQAELAERAEMSTGAIGALEQGLRRAPYRSTVERVADALNLNARHRTQLYAAADSSRGRKRKRPLDLAHTSNAPARLTSFVSRLETAEIARLSVDNRLVTVTGFAGVGKTRTVLEAIANHTSSDVVFIDLSPISDDDGVVLEIASAFRISISDAGDALHDLAIALRGRSVLLILDNCEHVISGVAAVVLEMLRSCPDVRVIATSREPLGLSSEIVYRLPFLSIPPVGVQLQVGSEYSALELFVTRAQATDARLTFSAEDLEAAADVCRRLDGIPLAIELAAGRASSLGVTGLRDRLNDLSFGSGAKDVPTRHQTMAAAISWSFGLLTEREHVLARRLSTLAGSFSLRCAETVCSDDQLPAEVIPDLVVQLVQKSLVESKSATTAYRYSMLASVRSYASSGLASAGETVANEDRLAAYLLGLLRETENGYVSLVAVPDIDNMRAAIEAKLQRGIDDDIAIAGLLVGSFRRLWMASGRNAELRRLCERIIARLDENVYIDIMALVWTALSATSRTGERRHLLQRAIRLNMRAGNHASAAAHLAQLAELHIYRDAPDEALAAANEANELLVRVPPGHRAQPFVRCSLAFVWSQTGDIMKARRCIEEIDRYFREHDSPDRKFAEAGRSAALAQVEIAAGNYAAARDVCLAAIQPHSDREEVIAYDANLQLSAVMCQLQLNEFDDAERQCRAVVDNWNIIINHTAGQLMLELAQCVATLVAARGDLDSAARLLGCSDEMITYFDRARDIGQRIVARNIREMLEATLERDRLAQLQLEGAHMTIAEARDLIDVLLP